MSQIEINEFLYYNARDNDFMVLHLCVEQLNRLGMTAVGFERSGISDIHLFTKGQLARVMARAKHWEYVGEI